TLSGKIDHNLPLSTGAAAAPGALPMRVLENVLLFQKYAVPDLLPWVLLLLVLPGLLARGRTSGWFGRDGILLAAALPPFASLGFHVEPRVFLPILPFILPFAAVGTLWAAVTLTDARRGWRWSLAMALLVALVLVPWTFQPILRPDAGAALYRQAARWVAETQPRDAVLLDRKPLIAFYSERRWVPLPRIGPDELLAAARHAGARLVVLDSREFFFDRPGLIPLLWGPPPPGLDVLRDFDAARATDAGAIHANGSRAMAYAGVAGRLAARPVLWHVRIADRDRLMDRALCAIATVVIATSRAVARRFAWAPAKIRLVPNGIDLAQLAPRPPSAAFRAKRGVPPAAPVAAPIGRHVPEKGYRHLIAAAALIERAKPGL